MHRKKEPIIPVWPLALLLGLLLTLPMAAQVESAAVVVDGMT